MTGPHRFPFALVLLLSLVILFAPASQVPSGIPISDKLVHATLFAALAATGYVSRLPAVPLALGLVAYAAGSEVLQALLPIGRDGDVQDALADVAGAAVGLAVAFAVARSRGRTRRNL